MAFWRDLVYLYEIDKDIWSIKPTGPSIHYAAKKILNRSQLLSDIEKCLQAAIDFDVLPAGRLYGRLTDDVIDQSYSQDELEILWRDGINPVVKQHNQAILFGHTFFDGDHWQYMRSPVGLSVAFRQFVKDNNITGPFKSMPVAKPPGVAKPISARDMAVHQAAGKRFGQIGVYVIDL